MYKGCCVKATITFQEMTESYSSSVKRGASVGRNSKNKIPQLTSTIPKLTPYVRTPVAKRATSLSSTPRTARTSIPSPTFRSADRGKYCSTFKNHSIFDPAAELQKNSRVASKQTPPTMLKTNVRPKSAAPAVRSPYSHVRSKINSNASPALVKSQLNSGDKPRPLTETDKSQVASEAGTGISFEHVIEQGAMVHDTIEKQRVLLKIDKELKKLQPADDLKPLEQEILHLLQNKTLNQLGSLTRENAAHTSSEVASEFLTSYEMQMQHLAKSWLELITDVVLTKADIGNDIMSHLILPDPSLNLREELFRFLSTLPSEDQPLHVKLQKIEEDHTKVTTTVMNLTRQHENLKDRHFRLEKTQDQVHFELKEELKILNDENKELVKRCEKAVDAYNTELLKTQRLEDNKKAIHRDSEHIKKQLKVMERKCAEFESKVAKTDALSRSLDVAIRNKDLASEKATKKHNEISLKLKKLQEIKIELDDELATANKNMKYLEMDKKELTEEVSVLKSNLEESEQKRTELVNELENKSKKLVDTQRDLDQLIARTTNGIHLKTMDEKDILIEDLTRKVHMNNISFNELQNLFNNAKHELQTKSINEEFLKQQVNELQRKPQELEVELNSKITELEYKVKDLIEENADLEKIVAQRTLELDNHDLLMKQHAHLLHTRDQLIPMLRNRQHDTQECIERLSAVVFEHQTIFCDHEPSNRLPSPRERSSSPPDMNTELEFRQEKMKEMFNLLEYKQMEVMRLERRLREIESTEKQHGERINTLNEELNQHGQKAKGFFTNFIGLGR